MPSPEPHRPLAQACPPSPLIYYLSNGGVQPSLGTLLVTLMTASNPLPRATTRAPPTRSTAHKGYQAGPTNAHPQVSRFNDGV